MDINEMLQNLKTDLDVFIAKQQEEVKTLGSVTTETKNTIQELVKRMDEIEVKAAKPIGGTSEKSLEETLKENEDVQRILRNRKGSCVFTVKGAQLDELLGRKTVITSDAVGSMTSGVLPVDRTAGIVAEARRRLRIRQLLTARPTSMQVIDFVKVNSPLVAPESPVPYEGADKYENTVTFTTQSEKVRTLATWIPASRQILDDFSELLGFLRASLPYYVDQLEENELLNGDGSEEHLHGLTHQAQAFDTNQLQASLGWSMDECIARSIQQIAAANEVEPTFVALHPNNYWDIMLSKDTTKRYLFATEAQAFHGLTPVPTTAMPANYFLVGSGNPAAAEIRDRMEMEVAISTEHDKFFTQNKVAIRAEKRMALVVYRPNAFVYGTFTTSPA